MSEKLENALRELQYSVENFEKSFVANQNRQPSKQNPQLNQNDLFGLSQDKSAQGENQGSNSNSAAMTAVLDRTINRMEKLVGDNS